MKKQSQRGSVPQKKHSIKQSTVVQVLSGLSILVTVLVFLSLLWNRSASNKFEVVLEEQNELIANAELFRDTSVDLTKQARFYAATSQQTYYDNYWQEVNTDKHRDLALANMQALGISTSEESMMESMSSQSNALVTYEEQSMALAAQGENLEAVALLFSGTYASGADQIQETAEKVIDSIQERKAAELESLNVIIDYSYYGVFICLLLIAVLQIFLISYVFKQMLAPALAVKDTMVELSRGNLDVVLSIPEDKTEVGQMVHAVNDTKARTRQLIDDISYVLQELSKGNFQVESHHESCYVGSYRPILTSVRALKQRQSQLMSQVGDTARQVSSESEQVSTSSQVLAQGAHEQAASIAALSDAISHISSDISANAQLVSNATMLVENTGAGIAEGNEKMQNMVSAMHEIEEKSNQIANIIKAIDDIAFQTNILALNAAVEAARAGTAGKGFAVVADEVRNLASKASQAAKDTAGLITESTNAVKKGAAIADETAQELQGVANNITEIVGTIRDIESASEQQSNSAAQITNGIEQITNVMQKTQSMASSSADTSESLSKQAQTLKNLVSQFRLAEPSKF